MSNPLYELVRDTPATDLTPVPAELADVPSGCLLDTLGMRLTDVGTGRSRVTMTLGPTHLNQRGLPQGGAYMALADAAAGWATYAAVPEGKFTTVQVACDLVGRADTGASLVALTEPAHLGRRMLVLNVQVMLSEHESADPPRKLIAQMSCTQLVIGS